jgi:hypothetical protein
VELVKELRDDESNHERHGLLSQSDLDAEVLQKREHAFLLLLQSNLLQSNLLQSNLLQSNVRLHKLAFFGGENKALPSLSDSGPLGILIFVNLITGQPLIRDRLHPSSSRYGGSD